MDGDLFTYEDEVANIPCDSNMYDDSKHEADDDMRYDPSDVTFTEWGNDEVELTDEESSNNEDDVAEREDGYCNGGNFPGAYVIRNSLHYQDLEWYEALEDCELKEEALRNKANMEGLIEEDDDDESRYEQRRRWNVYTNYDDAYEINHDVVEREELCEIHELPACNIRRFEMIKYSFGQDKEYVSIKEDEYEDLARTSEDACRAYQEIFRMMNEGWIVTRAE
ncbi:hypothetical protein Tco_1278596 [Tanacetum coccineum]